MYTPNVPLFRALCVMEDFLRAVGGEGIFCLFLAVLVNQGSRIQT